MELTTIYWTVYHTHYWRQLKNQGFADCNQDITIINISFTVVMQQCALVCADNRTTEQAELGTNTSKTVLLQTTNTCLWNITKSIIKYFYLIKIQVIYNLKIQKYAHDNIFFLFTWLCISKCLSQWWYSITCKLLLHCSPHLELCKQPDLTACTVERTINTFAITEIIDIWS